MPEGRLARTRRIYNRDITRRSDCPPNSIYFLPSGSTTWNVATGAVVERLKPGVYAHPSCVVTDNGFTANVIEGDPFEMTPFDTARDYGDETT